MGVNKVIYYGEVLVDMSQVTVTPETLGKGATALDAKGELITGLHECEETEPKLQSKTVTPTTSLQTVNPDSGYDGLSKVTVNAMPTATQATPSISVSSGGLITASATQSAGYVSAGTKSATKQLTTQAAKTITPTKSAQTAVASGVYTTGAITVAAIPSQYITTTDATAVAADIRTGKTGYVNGAKITGSIQDFDGSYECSGDSTGGSGGGKICSVTVDMSGGSTGAMMPYVQVYYASSDNTVSEPTFDLRNEPIEVFEAQAGILAICDPVRGSSLYTAIGNTSGGARLVTHTGLSMLFEISDDCTIDLF